MVVSKEETFCLYSPIKNRIEIATPKMKAREISCSDLFLKKRKRLVTKKSRDNVIIIQQDFIGGAVSLISSHTVYFQRIMVYCSSLLVVGCTILFSHFFADAKNNRLPAQSRLPEIAVTDVSFYNSFDILVG